MRTAAEEDRQGMERQLRNLKDSRRGKKGSNTNRIKQLVQLVQEPTRRMRLLFLADALGTQNCEGCTRGSPHCRMMRMSTMTLKNYVSMYFTTLGSGRGFEGHCVEPH